MAVNDYFSTEKLKEASDFFSKLEHSKEFEVKEEDREMMFAAALAATFFANPHKREKVTKELDYEPENSFTNKSTVEEVTSMCAQYVDGERKFDGYQAEQARRLCNVLLEYVEKSERKRPISLGISFHLQ